MAICHEPVFTQKGRIVCAVATAAKITYNDSVNAVKLCDAGADGSLLKGLSAMPAVAPTTAITATKLMLLASPDNGTTMFLVASALMAAHTVAHTTATATTYFSDFGENSPLRFQPAWNLWVGIGVAWAGGIVFNGQVEDF